MSYGYVHGRTSAPVPSLSLIGFDPAAYTVGDTDGEVALVVKRAGSTVGACSAGFATADGTAVAGVHYLATTTTLSWVAGDPAAKQVEVPMLTGGVRLYNGTLVGGEGFLWLAPAIVYLGARGLVMFPGGSFDEARAFIRYPGSNQDQYAEFLVEFTNSYDQISSNFQLHFATNIPYQNLNKKIAVNFENGSFYVRFDDPEMGISEYALFNGVSEIPAPAELRIRVGLARRGSDGALAFGIEIDEGMRWLSGTSGNYSLVDDIAAALFIEDVAEVDKYLLGSVYPYDYGNNFTFYVAHPWLAGLPDYGEDYAPRYTPIGYAYAGDPEGSKVFSVALSAPVGATLGAAAATVRRVEKMNLQWNPGEAFAYINAVPEQGGKVINSGSNSILNSLSINDFIRGASGKGYVEIFADYEPSAYDSVEGTFGFYSQTNDSADYTDIYLSFLSNGDIGFNYNSTNEGFSGEGIANFGFPVLRFGLAFDYDSGTVKVGLEDGSTMKWLLLDSENATASLVASIADASALAVYERSGIWTQLTFSPELFGLQLSILDTATGQLYRPTGYSPLAEIDMEYLPS